MQKLKSVLSRLSKNLKFSITNPETFKEVLSFNSNWVRVFSLTLILLLGTALFSIFLVGGFDSLFNNEQALVQRGDLEEQSTKIETLYSKIEAQENYINNIKSILNAEIQQTLTSDTLMPDLIAVDVSGMDSKQTDAEKNLSQKIKDDMSTGLSKQKSIIYFGEPVTGVVSQEFNAESHPGIDIITKKEQIVKNCGSYF